MSNKTVETKVPKKRGRKPGSKNKVKKADKRGSAQTYYQLESELLSLMESVRRAQESSQKEIQKLEEKNQKETLKLRLKLEASIALWKNRAKEYRKKLTVTGNKKGRVGRPASKPLAPKGKRGRPAKSELGQRRGGGRKRAGELTKKDIIMNFMKEVNKPMTSKELITGLFAKSGEKDMKRFSQGVYTTLTQIYKGGELINKDGLIQLA
jgi:hypothetical protein